MREKEIRKGTERGKTMSDGVVYNGGTLTNGLDSPFSLSHFSLISRSLSLTRDKWEWRDENITPSHFKEYSSVRIDVISNEKML